MEKTKVKPRLWETKAQNNGTLLWKIAREIGIKSAITRVTRGCRHWGKFISTLRRALRRSSWLGGKFVFTSWYATCRNFIFNFLYFSNGFKYQRV